VIQPWLNRFIAYAAAAMLMACPDASRAVAILTDEAVGAYDASAPDTSTSVSSARTFLSRLDDGQRPAAAFAFDDPERMRWSYVPRARSGIPLQAMTAEQRAAAFDLLDTGLSERGAARARGGIDNECNQRAIERAPRSIWAARRETEH
jgi:hypothetical protein